MASSTRVSTQAQERLAAGLAMIAGYVDSFGQLHYQTYVSFMSGNTTQSGLKLGLRDWSAAIPALVAIGFFVIGVFAGTLLAHTSSVQSLQLRFGLVAVLLAAIIVVTKLGSIPSDIGIATLSFAMGFMNTTLAKVGAQPVALGYVTGSLNALAQHVALALKRAPLPNSRGSWDTHQRRALQLMGVWAAFLTGAVVSAAANSRFGVWVLLPPVLVLLALAIFDSEQLDPGG